MSIWDDGAKLLKLLLLEIAEIAEPQREKEHERSVPLEDDVLGRSVCAYEYAGKANIRLDYPNGNRCFICADESVN